LASGYKTPFSIQMRENFLHNLLNFSVKVTKNVQYFLSFKFF
jgi:hypothetical protein